MTRDPTIEEVIAAIDLGPDEEQSMCRLCGHYCSMDAELEPTPLCHDCAQIAVVLLFAEVLQLRGCRRAAP